VSERNQLRERNSNWRGGRSIASTGYILVRVGTDHHLADVRGYAYEHRLVAEQKLGRRLLPGEIPHHIDGNKANNDPDNLEIVASAAEHRLHHRKNGSNRRLPGKPNPVIECACGCGETFRRFDAHGRPRAFMSGHNPHEATARAAFLRALSDGPLTIRELVGKLGSTPSAVKTLAWKLSRAGLVVRARRGVYARGEN
jgi:hypothetical protein